MAVKIHKNNKLRFKNITDIVPRTSFYFQA